MSTIHVNEVHTNFGSVWQRCVALWSEYVIQETWTFAFVFTSANVGHASLDGMELTITGDTDTTVYTLLALDSVTVIGRFPLAYITSRPGWYTAPRALPNTVGARDVLVDADTNLWGMRNAIWGGLALNPLFATSSYTNNLVITGANNKMWTGVADLQEGLAFDFVCITVVDPASAYPFYEGITPSSSSPQAASVVSAGSVDLTPLVGPLTEIASKDVDFSINNGGSMFSIYSRVKMETR